MTPRTQRALRRTVKSFGFTLAAAGLIWAAGYLPTVPNLPPQFVAYVPVLTAVLMGAGKWLQRQTP